VLYDRSLLGTPLRSAEGVVIADLDPTLIHRRKHLMDSRGHDSWPALLSLLIDRSTTAHVHERVAKDGHERAVPSKQAAEQGARSAEHEGLSF
jgi:hypothetical protein